MRKGRRVPFRCTGGLLERAPQSPLKGALNPYMTGCRGPRGLGLSGWGEVVCETGYIFCLTAAERGASYKLSHLNAVTEDSRIAL
jgi:hypothetical protein